MNIELVKQRVKNARKVPKSTLIHERFKISTPTQ